MSVNMEINATKDTLQGDVANDKMTLMTIS